MGLLVLGDMLLIGREGGSRRTAPSGQIIPSVLGSQVDMAGQ